MKYNFLPSVLTGIIIGGILGGIFYVMPAKLLICGPLPYTTWLPPEVWKYMMLEIFHWGVIPGAIIGFIGGCNRDVAMPHGHLSKSIGASSYVICTILAYVTQGSNLAYMSASRIAITIIITALMFFLCLAYSQIFSFIETIREKGGVS